MPLLANLKNATAQQHADLEAGMDLLRRAGTAEGYKELIAKFYTLYVPLEEKLAGAADWRALDWDFESRRKVGWLEEDLRALGLKEAEMAGLPLCADLPALDSVGAAVGCLYVLEGSTLGGQMISKLLRQKLDMRPETGGKFFLGYGEHTARRWRAFMVWAEALAAKDPEIEPAAIAAAKSTFDGFARWFQV